MTATAIGFVLICFMVGGDAPPDNKQTQTKKLTHSTLRKPANPDRAEQAKPQDKQESSQADKTGPGDQAPKNEPSNPFRFDFFLPRSQAPDKGMTPEAATTAVIAHPIDPALILLAQCKERWNTVSDYSATLVTQDLVGITLMPEMHMQAKFRKEPFSVYLRQTHPQVGRESIYVEGANDNRILTHGTGISKAIEGTVRLNPDSPEAKQDNRLSVRELGIGKLIDRLILRWEFERNFQETQVSITEVKVNGRPCQMISTVHPKPDDGKFMFHTLRVYVDKEWMLPIRTEGFGYPKTPGTTPGRLLESHTYLNLEINPGFSDLDFSEGNPSYSFSRF